jgi:hypothetical protein
VVAAGVYGRCIAGSQGEEGGGILATATVESQDGVLVMKRLWAFLAVLGLLGVMVAAPASAAAKPISGRLDFDFVGPAASCNE